MTWKKFANLAAVVGVLATLALSSGADWFFGGFLGVTSTVTAPYHK